MEIEIKSIYIMDYISVEEKDETNEIKNKNDFIFINNRGFNVNHISGFYYNNSNESICVRILELRIWEWFVPLSESVFILGQLQNALNRGEDINFYFSKNRKNSKFLSRLFNSERESSLE